MSNMAPGSNNGPQQTEGISTKAWVTFVLVAFIVLFLVFFTWFENTSNITPPPSNVNNGNSSPFSFSGSN